MEFLKHQLFWLCLLSPLVGRGQMVTGPDTLTGNEWIRYGEPYYKFTVTADGVYRLTYATLTAAGMMPAGLTGDAIRLYSLGREVPIHVSTGGPFGPNDYIEFYGRRNDGEMDRHLYLRPDDDMLNSDHSLYTDERPYFLTLHTEGQPARTIAPAAILGDAAPYHLHRETIAFEQTLNDPYYPLAGAGAISYSSYMHAEGFAKSSESSSQTTVAAANRAPGGPDAALRIRFATTNYGTHRYIIGWNGTALDTIFLRDLDFIDTTLSIPLASLSDQNLLTLTGMNTQSRHALVRIEITYPRPLALPLVDEVSFVIPQSEETMSWSFSGFVHNDEFPIAYSTDGRYRQSCGIAPPDQVMLTWGPVDTSTAVVVVHPANGIASITDLQAVTFTDITADDTEYIVITHPDIMPTGTDSEYIQYRMSEAGGSYTAKAYSILDLYDQFGYGIEKHPQAIRNFVEFASRNWPSANMFYIIGRGIEYNRSRNPGESWESSFFVPTFGRPGSDQLLMATVWDLIPRYPVGRLAVTSPAGVAEYLEKMKAHDIAAQVPQTIEAKRWIKNVMHIGGGKNTSEQSDFEATMLSLQEQLESSDYGANVSFFQKTSTDIIGESQSARILELLQEGCGLINYLGHSGSTTFEFNISEPAEWNNTGRYPVFSAMGCSAGQIHGPVMSLSDNYVQIPGEGAIAFISGSGSQYAAALTEWAQPWYEYIGNIGYGAPLGESTLHGLRALDKYVDPELTGANQYRFLLEQQTLQGDPAIRLYALPGSDYLPDRRAVKVEPGVLSTDLDSFDLAFSIFNIGRNIGEDVPYTVSIRRTGGTDTEVLRDTVRCERYETSLRVRLPLATDDQAGTFRLLIHVDPDNRVAEAPAPGAEDNNILTDNLGQEGIELVVSDNRIGAIHPPRFAIVNDPVPVMTAGGTNSFAPGDFVTFEIDTNGLFDSPFKLRERFKADAATVSWSPGILWTPGVVYYWRVSADSLSPEQDFVWDKRSFIYLPGSPDGWNQSHFHQWTDNDLHHLRADSLQYEFPFTDKTKDFRILNRYHDYDIGLIPQVALDGVVKAEFFTGFRPHPIHVFVVAIDSLTGEFMLNPNPGLYGSFNPLSFDAPCFAYRTDTPESRQNLIDFVENIIPAGHYVFFYTYQRTPYPDYFPEQWASDEGTFGKSIFSLIESQVPTSAIRTLENTGSVPYIVLFRKDRGGIEELIAADTTEVISMIPDLRSSLDEGRMTTPPIGPASAWREIRWLPTSLPADSIGINNVEAWAYGADLQDSVLISASLPPDTLLDAETAPDFPYLKLILNTQDSVTYEPMNLSYWRVLYDGVPELTIRTDLGFFFYADTLFQGDTMRLMTYIENVTAYPVDSVQVVLRMTDANNITTEVWETLRDLPTNGAVPVSFKRSTIDLAGDYQLVMQVNPGGTVPELDLRNNTGFLQMHVVEDDVNPILEVTFDGFRIRDGDLVSARPLIQITLTDENERKRLSDTSHFDMHLQFPSDFEPRRIVFTEPWVEFIPAQATGPNIAQVLLRPDLVEEGYYTLIVNATDGSGNAAGDIDYTITFRVDHAEAVSYIYSYPNPFRYTTQFVYSLSGNGNPPDYRIEIVHSSGVKVRDITKDELGPLPAGTHATTYAWDGSDADGSPLPSGMYLYRLVVRDANGNDYPLLNVPENKSATDKGWGKLIIIR